MVLIQIRIGWKQVVSKILFQDHRKLALYCRQVIGRLKAMGSASEARALALDVRRMCAAIRASLETHVRR